MALSGHRTRSVFSRYNITSFDDLTAAASMLDVAAGQPAKLPTERRTARVRAFKPRAASA